MRDNLKVLVDLFHSAVPQTSTMIFTMGGGFIGVKFISELGLTALKASNYISTLQFFTITPLNSAISYQTNSAEDNPDAIAQGHVRNLQRTWCYTIAFSGLTLATMFSMVPTIMWSSEDAEVNQLVKSYLFWFAPGVPGMFLLNSYRQIMLATGSAWTSVPFYFFYQTIDTLLSYALIKGKFLFPEMGFPGLAVANTVSIWITVALFSVYIYEGYRNKGINIFEYRLTNKDRIASIKALIKESWHKFYDNLFYTLRIFSDQGLLYVSSLMMGPMGNIQNAAQEAAYQYVPLCSTLVYGPKDAIGKLIGKSWSSSSLNETQRIAYLGLAWSVITTSIPFIIFLCTPEPLLKIFIHGSNDEQHAVMQLAKQLLWINGAGLVVDAARNSAISTINNFKQPWFPLPMIGLSFAGILLAYLLGFHTSLEAKGVMIARDIILGLGAIFSLTVMFYLLKNAYMHSNSNNNQIVADERASNEATPLLIDTRYNSSSLLASSESPASSANLPCGFISNIWQSCTGRFWKSAKTLPINESTATHELPFEHSQQRSI